MIRTYLLVAILTWTTPVMAIPDALARFRGGVPADSLRSGEPRRRPLLRTLSVSAVPMLCIVYGAATRCPSSPFGMEPSLEAREEMREKYPRFRSHFDDFLQHAPLAAVATLDACGVPAAHRPAGQLMRLATSMGLMAGVVTALKYTVHEERPDHSDDNSFPSGHTATSFAAAELLHQEFRGQVAVVVGGYAVATSVGVLRMLNDKHWLGDVVTGAGIGMLSTKLVYWSMDRLHRRTRAVVARPARGLRVVVAPGWQPGGVALTVAVVGR